MRQNCSLNMVDAQCVFPVLAVAPYDTFYTGESDADVEMLSVTKCREIFHSFLPGVVVKL